MGRHGLPDRLADNILQGLVCPDLRKPDRLGAAQNPLFGQQLGYGIGADIRAVRKDGKGAEQIFKLCIIIRPRILAQKLQRPGLKPGKLFAQFKVKAVKVKACQGRYLVGTAAQRRQRKRQIAKAYKQLLIEALV